MYAKYGGAHPRQWRFPMIKLLSLTASPSPGPEPLTWDRVREGVSWFFSNLSPAFV